VSKFPIDALWIGEIVRQAILFAHDMQWIALTESQETKLLALISLVITGAVGKYTASTRVLERAGTSVDQVKKVADPSVNARMLVAGTDAHMVPDAPMDFGRKP
jgi:hypothetical protein